MRALALAVLLLAAPPARAAVIGHMTPARPLTAERLDALPVAERAAWRDYLARSDAARGRNAGEAQGGPPPPTGNAARSMPLDRPAAWYASAEARHVADVIVSFQTPAGGWSKNTPRDGALRRAGQSYGAEAGYLGTLDNDATVTELRFLARVVTATPQASGAWRDSFARGLGWLLDAQYPNGGWPQVWPLVGGYHDAVTFNDGAMLGALRLLRDVAAGRGDYAFADAAQRRAADAAFRRGRAALMTARVEGAVWPQQADVLTLAPTGARNYEPAAFSSAESAAIVGWLMDQRDYGPDAVRAVQESVAWFKAAALTDKAVEPAHGGRPPRLVDQPGAPPLWARFYSLETHRPVFGDRDRTIHDHVEDLSQERRYGYAWFGSAPRTVLARYPVWLEGRVGRK